MEGTPTNRVPVVSIPPGIPKNESSLLFALASTEFPDVEEGDDTMTEYRLYPKRWSVLLPCLLNFPTAGFNTYASDDPADKVSAGKVDALAGVYKMSLYPTQLLSMYPVSNYLGLATDQDWGRLELLGTVVRFAGGSACPRLGSRNFFAPWFRPCLLHPCCRCSVVGAGSRASRSTGLGRVGPPVKYVHCTGSHRCGGFRS
jgi:hypothetical protein